MPINLCCEQETLVQAVIKATGQLYEDKLKLEAAQLALSTHRKKHGCQPETCAPPSGAIPTTTAIRKHAHKDDGA
jgi:hypothetical protein